MRHSLRYLGLLLLGGLLPLAGLGQSAGMSQEFMASTVVLTNGDTLRGSLSLRLDMELLLITMADKTVRTVPALAVQTFAVRGEIMPLDRLTPQARGSFNQLRGRRRWHDLQRARQFLVYPWNHDRDYAPANTPAFFERLNGGPVILMRRQQLVRRSVPWSDLAMPTDYAMRSMSSTNMPYYYTDVREMLYLATPQGAIVALRKPRRDLLTYFAGEAAQIEQYAQQEGLSFQNTYHLARLVDYANRLQAVALQ